MIIKEHIKEAEKLLINGNEFDKEERIPFIKNLNSCDLLAVPGSGKTTALLAKLYCLSKHLPFKDGSGILVLSHTNAAVEEIEKNLKPYCPKLFEYPNFVGTVQSFINKFLANQACFEKYGSYITQNEDDLKNNIITSRILNNKSSKIFGFLSNLIRTKNNKLTIEYLEEKGIKNPKLLLSKYAKLEIINDKGELQKIRDNYTTITSLPQQEKQVIFDFNNDLKSLIEDANEFKDIIKTIKYDEKNNCFYSDYFPSNWRKKLRANTNSGAELKLVFEDLRKNGILRYYDSFLLSKEHLDNHPELKFILEKRFNFVFIDEMQDLEKYQIDIIDDIFKSKDSNTILQRIGDINQSIYSSGKKVKVEADWEPREQMYLNGSNRLTPEIANIVNNFTLDKQQNEDGKPRFLVKGLRQLEEPIKPHLILFDKQSVELLEETFKYLINKYSLQETKEAKKYGFKIIGWNAKWDDDDNHNEKLRLEDIFKYYKKETKTNKETFDTLNEYLQLFDHNELTLKAAKRTVLNSLIHILRLEGVKYKVKIRGQEVERYYNKSEMIKYIKNPENNCDYEYFKKLVYACSYRLVITKQYSVVYRAMKKFILNRFKNWFSLTIKSETELFIGNEFKELIVDKDNNGTNDVYSDNSINVDIGTVHSAKGQTHCATMYVETSYHDYESNKLIVVEKKATKTKPEVLLPNPLCGQEHKYREGKDKYAKQTLKMMYVGFSRPTHLLCFAALKNNIGENKQVYVKAGWIIEDLTETKEILQLNF